MTHDERKAYSKGYSAGRQGRWPAHVLPDPPNHLIAEMMSAADAQSSAIENLCAQLGWEQDDEFVLLMAPLVDRFKASQVEVGRYL